MIALTLPYPISANRYWRPVRIGKHITIVPTKEAKAYRVDVGTLCAAAGIKAPITGRVEIGLRLYPNRPKDFASRMRKLGEGWDDTVQCIDLDNANKVVLDALKGVAIEDDKWVRSLQSERMEPDEKGARVVVFIRQVRAKVVQETIIECTADARVTLLPADRAHARAFAAAAAMLDAANVPSAGRMFFDPATGELVGGAA